MTDPEKILAFIARFHGSEDTFLHGCCYWFAHILDKRFWRTDAVDILYEPVEGHFITKINNRLYDVRGEVTELYRGKPMYSLDALRHDSGAMYRHLMRDCRDFEEEGNG